MFRHSPFIAVGILAVFLGLCARYKKVFKRIFYGGTVATWSPQPDYAKGLIDAGVEQHDKGRTVYLHGSGVGRRVYVMGHFWYVNDIKVGFPVYIPGKSDHVLSGTAT